MKRIFRTAPLVVIMLFALLFVSCGTSADGGDDTTAFKDTTAVDTTAADTTAEADTTAPADTEEIKPDPPKSESNKIFLIRNIQKFTFTASNGESLPYCMYIPESYSEDYAYPLLLFLHGAGCRGADEENGSQVEEGVQGLFVPSKTPTYDAIAVFPLCDSEARWVETDWEKGNYSVDDVEISRNMVAVVELLDYIIENYSINTNRQYVTGLSMGGYGTWDLIMRYPDRFAAAAPLCGAGDPSKAEELKDLPIWAFHDIDDDAVPVSGTQNMVSAIKAAGGEKILYTESQGFGHRIWDGVYNDPEFQTWLFSQRKD